MHPEDLSPTLVTASSLDEKPHTVRKQISQNRLTQTCRLNAPHNLLYVGGNENDRGTQTGGNLPIEEVRLSKTHFQPYVDV